MKAGAAAGGTRCAGFPTPCDSESESQTKLSRPLNLMMVSTPIAPELENGSRDRPYPLKS
eukprot:3315659-Rhodomonas_salina.1